MSRAGTEEQKRGFGFVLVAAHQINQINELINIEDGDNVACRAQHCNLKMHFNP